MSIFNERMKTKITNIAILLLLLTGITGCKDDLTELNIKPDEPLSTDPNYLLTYALQQGMGNYNSDVTLEQWSLMNWTMFMAGRGGLEPGKEYEIPGGKDDFWREQYTHALSNTQLIIDLTSDDPNGTDLHAIAKIWKVALFHRITDLWGPVPYLEALSGITSFNYAPKYDKQQDIYIHMMDELKSAHDIFQHQGNLPVPAHDLIFNGNTEHWMAFGNSLLLRLATQIRCL
jgi:hypothetical protein